MSSYGTTVIGRALNSASEALSVSIASGQCRYLFTVDKYCLSIIASCVVEFVWFLSVSFIKAAQRKGDLQCMVILSPCFAVPPGAWIGICEFAWIGVSTYARGLDRVDYAYIPSS